MKLDDLLTRIEELRATIKARHNIYGDAYNSAAKIMELLGDKWDAESEITQEQYILIVQIVCKLVRATANKSKLHRDSVKDIAGYALILLTTLDRAMLEEVGV